MRERLKRLMLLSGALIALGALTLAVPVSALAPPEAAQLRGQLAGVPVPFIANQGQVDARVAYYAPTFAGTLFVTRQGETVYALGGPRTEAEGAGWSLAETLVGGRARPAGMHRSPTGISSFLGHDPARWRSELPTWEQVDLGEVWPGVTLTLRAQGRSTEKVCAVHPGAVASRIRVRVAGAQALAVNAEGALVASTGLGNVTFTAPVAYQERDGVRHPVAVAYRRQGMEYGFSVGDYDPDRPLVIDPLLQSTYLGGLASDEANAVAIHPVTGDVYVAGRTASSPFPGTAGGARPVFSGDSDAFIARLPRTLTSLTQVTYLGGSGLDQALALAIHPATGDVYAAGFTTSLNFPGTAGGAQPVSGGLGGDHDGFVARLPRTLTSLTQATYLGGISVDQATGLAIHPASGDVHVAGFTNSDNFPGTAGGAQPVRGGSQDVFVARLAASLTSLIRATFVGGADNEFGAALAIHPATGDVYVAGSTASSPFPGIAGGAQTVLDGLFDAFVVRLPPALTSFTQSTYLGGSNMEEATALAIHPATGDVYVAGYTSPIDSLFVGTFPGNTGGAQAVFGGNRDGFAARLSSALTTLIQATFLGGSEVDRATALAIHPWTGDVYVAGFTDSSDFPGTAGGAQPESGGSTDAFVARLPSTLTSLTRATYLGGGSGDLAFRPGDPPHDGRGLRGRLHPVRQLSRRRRGAAAGDRWRSRWLRGPTDVQPAAGGSAADDPDPDLVAMGHMRPVRPAAHDRSPGRSPSPGAPHAGAPPSVIAAGRRP